MLHPAAEFGAEKYLLEEMSPVERDAFEEHCFACPECAAELQTTASFLDAARRGMLNTPPVAKPMARRSWRHVLTRPAFLSPAVAILLLIILGFQTAVHPGLHAPDAAEILPVVSLVGGDSRGTALPIVRVTSTQSFIISLDVTLHRWAFAGSIP